MIKLPVQLQNKSFRFIKIKKGKKAPAEEDWPMTNNYKYNDPDFIDYLKTASAYGVACGFGKLAIIDCDNTESANSIMEALPDTFTVFSPGHKNPHLYFIIKGLTEKIIMTDGNKIHHGEVQFTGAQALGPNSLHPNKKFYTVLKDIPIKVITKEQLLAVITPYIKPPKKGTCTSTGIEMNIALVAEKIKGLNLKSGELVGSHPVHGSEGGTNFRINEEKNNWFCFRCNHGGDAVDLVAVLEGIIDCEPGSDWNNHFSGSGENKKKFLTTLKIAEKKYGYIPPETVVKKKQFEISRPITNAELRELKKPNLIFNILREVQKEGVVGEEESILVLINRIGMRCVKNYTLTSGNIIVSDGTGLGKDNVTEKLCKVMLVKNKTLYSATCISDKALNYWHPGFEDASWDGRVMYLQDPEEDTLKGQAFKVRASGINENVTLDTERKIQYIQIKGKPILIVTSMSASINEELMRRWDSVHLDPSKELTEAIVNYICQKAMGNMKTETNNVLRNAIRNLPRVNVFVPFATEIVDLVPVENSAMRTQISKLIDIIKASAALHQFQRETDENGYVLATREDLAYAIFITNYCASVLNGQVLTRRQEAFLEYLKKRGEPVPIKKILKDIPGTSQMWVYRQEKDLVERRLIQMNMIYDTAAGRDIKHFELDLVFNVVIKIPKNLTGYFYKQLEKDINAIRKNFKLNNIELFGVKK